jgi:two-component system response regulator FixJ
MHRYKTLSIIDTNIRRRADRCRNLGGGRFHVEPYESVSEFSREGDTETLLLVSDQLDALSEIMQDMRDRGYWAPTLGYGACQDPVRCSRIVLGGLIGYLPDEFNLADLTNFLDDAASEITALIDMRYAAAKARARLKRLTNREAQVLEHLGSGLTNREIADVLSISHRTVEIHRANMLRKMDAQTAIAAVRVASHAEFGV